MDIHIVNMHYSIFFLAALTIFNSDNMCCYLFFELNMQSNLKERMSESIQFGMWPFKINILIS